MNRRDNKAGFTLVELMVGVMLTGIIVLVAGVVLQCTQRGLKQQTAVANLQDDMRVALPALYELARERSSGDVMVPALGATGTLFTVGTTNIYRGNDTLTAVSNGLNLVYARGADKMVLSKGLVRTFSVSRATNSITFVLVLDNTNDTMSVSNRIYFRN